MRLIFVPADHCLRTMHTLFSAVESHGRKMCPSRSRLPGHRSSTHRHRLHSHRSPHFLYMEAAHANAAKNWSQYDLCPGQPVSIPLYTKKFETSLHLSSSTVASIIRLVITVAHIPPGPDITWNFVPFVQWSATELYTALATANLPSLGPLVRGRWGDASPALCVLQAATPRRPGSSTRQLGRSPILQRCTLLRDMVGRRGCGCRTTRMITAPRYASMRSFSDTSSLFYV